METPERVAVPEDDAAQTELMQSCLREADHDCHAFAAGSEFKSVLQHETFDLLVIDWNPPNTSGPDVQRVHNQPACVRDFSVQAARTQAGRGRFV